MAKIRVHELAKKYNMPSSEVMAKLVAAGIEVKAAATAVDQTMADAALTGKKVKKPSENGGTRPQRPRATGDLGIRDLGARPPEGVLATRVPAPPPPGGAPRRPATTHPQPEPPQPAPAAPKTAAAQPAPDPNRREGAGGGPGSRRPTRSSLQGERTPGAAGG